VTMSSLNVDELTLQIDGATLLSSVTMQINPGDICALVGPNGAGKSSLLKCLVGELSPTIGSVSLQGKPLPQWLGRERAKLLSVLPQQSALNFPFRVEEVVALGRYPHNTGIDCDRQIVAEVIEAIDINHLLGRSYTTLSGGEKQRVHLARVLVQIWRPCVLGDRYLLLDEPTAALDLAHQHMVLKVARLMAEQGVGVFVILHDLNLAAQYADKLVMLNKGHIVTSGDVEEVLTQYYIEQTFGVAVTVIPHPHTNRPLIVYNGLD
jgi:iron complex transport system ATP-binding protein